MSIATIYFKQLYTIITIEVISNRIFTTKGNSQIAYTAGEHVPFYVLFFFSIHTIYKYGEKLDILVQ